MYCGAGHFDRGGGGQEMGGREAATGRGVRAREEEVGNDMRRKRDGEPSATGPGRAAAPLSSQVAEVKRICVCAHLRGTARAVTQVFDAALQPTGLRATQLTVLIAVAAAPGAPMSSLAEALVMDRTTLTQQPSATREAGPDPHRPGPRPAQPRGHADPERRRSSAPGAAVVGAGAGAHRGRPWR